jgi:hypothetical protein
MFSASSGSREVSSMTSPRSSYRSRESFRVILRYGGPTVLHSDVSLLHSSSMGSCNVTLASSVDLNRRSFIHEPRTHARHAGSPQTDGDSVLDGRSPHRRRRGLG